MGTARVRSVHHRTDGRGHPIRRASIRTPTRCVSDGGRTSRQAQPRRVRDHRSRSRTLRCHLFDGIVVGRLTCGATKEQHLGGDDLGRVPCPSIGAHPAAVR